MRLYIAGPMTGIPQFNFPAFDAVAASLRMMGFDAVSPAELDDEVDRAAALASPYGDILEYGKGVKKTWGEFLARDVRLIADGGIGGVFVLSGWERSRGARLETFVAYLCGMPIFRSLGTDFGVYRAGMEPVPPLDLFRAWSAEPHLSIERPFAVGASS